MIDIVSTDKCCLCGNCENVCPTNAISFTREEKTFLYPNIDKDKCIGCSKCESVCPVLNPMEQKKVLKSFAVKNKNEDIIKHSTSGGIFTALAQKILSKGGVVYGAAFQDDFTVKHIMIKDCEKISLIRGSKYVQSDLGNVFLDIKQRLKDGETVLFSGCPCQCAALRTYLKEQEYGGQLYVVDFICHGILSEKLFKEYLEYLEAKHKSKIVKFTFRDKRYGWADSGPRIIYANGKSQHWPYYEDLYMQGCFQGLCERESCYTCSFKNFYSGSDLTMGDFWGAAQLMPDFYDRMGVSVLCIQSEVGMELFEQVKELLVLEEAPVEILAKHNQGLFKPFVKGKKSDEFFEMAKKMGNIKALEQITKISKVEKLKRLYRQFRRVIANRKINS